MELDQNGFWTVLRVARDQDSPILPVHDPINVMLSAHIKYRTDR